MLLSYWQKTKKFFLLKLGIEMKSTIRNKIKISKCGIDFQRRFILQLGYELIELVSYDTGEVAETWVNSKGNKVIFEVVDNEKMHWSSQIIDEIIDCWAELRSIKNFLMSDNEVINLSSNKEQTPWERYELMERELMEESIWGSEIKNIIFRDDIDLSVLSFVLLDDEDKRMLLN